MPIGIDDKVCAVANPGGQADFAADWTNFMCALEGGWMSGKTWAGARKLLSLHLYNAFTDDGEATYVPSAVVAPTYSNAIDFDVPELQAACKEANVAVKWKASGPITSGQYYGPALLFPELGTRARPSVILVRTADSPDRITGWQVGASWGDEPSRWAEDRHDPKRDAFLQLTGRVRHPEARFIQMNFTYTNEGDATRIYEEMHSGKPGRQLYRAATHENPVAVEFEERQRDYLTKDLARQYLGGEAISIRGGRVYPSFDPILHVNNNVVLRQGLPLHMSLDFNITPGMHAELGQYSEEKDRLSVTHEIHGPRMSVRSMVQVFYRMTQPGGELHPWRWPELQIFGDATGSAEWAATGESCYDVLREGLQQCGIPFRLRVPRSNPPVIDRVNAFEVALMDIHETVHWQCHSRCQRLVEDLQTLKRTEYGEIDRHDKKLSHPSSAEGYRIWYLRPVRKLSAVVGGRFGVTVP